MRLKTHSEFINELKTKNPNVTVIGNYINCSTKLEVQCNKCNHIWYTTPNSLTRGHGCPQCANNQKKSHEFFIDEMRIHNPHIEIIGHYESATTPLWVKCKICGNEWLCKPNRLLNGAQCQNCIKPHTSFMEQFMLIALQTALGKNSVLSRNTSAIDLELDIYIPKHNLAIEPGTWLYHKNKANKLDLTKRNKCKEKGIRLITIYDTYPTHKAPPFSSDCYVYEGFLNEPGYPRLIDFLENLMSQYSIDYSNLDWSQIASKAYEACHYNAHENFIKLLAEKAPNIEVLEAYKGTNTPILVKNKNCNHPSWKARPLTLLNGIGCPICGRISAAKTHTRTPEKFKQELKEINPSITVLSEYTKATERVSVRCKKCNYEWAPLAYSLLSGKGCPHCSAKEGAKKRNNKLAVKTTKAFAQELKAINPNIIVIGEYTNNKTKLLVECSICKKQWMVVPASLLHGHGCPSCARKRKALAN